MARDLKAGDKVSWKSHGGEAHGELGLRPDRLAGQGEAGDCRPNPGQPTQRLPHATASRAKNPSDRGAYQA